MAAHKENLQLLIGAKDKASPILNKVKGAVIGIGAAYLGWQGVKSMIGGIVSAGLESEQIWNDVRASLERHNYAVDEGLKSVQAFSSALQDQTGISDELGGISIQTLLDYNNDLKTSFEVVEVAADLAAGAHMDLRAAVDLLGKASVGYTSALSRYGIIIDDSIPASEKFAAVLEQINSRFGGAAAAKMESTAGQIDLLEQRWIDFQEQLFQKVAPAMLHVVKGLSALTGMLCSTGEAVHKITEEEFKAMDDELKALNETIATLSTSLLEFTATSEVVRRFEEMNRIIKEGGEVSQEAFQNMAFDFQRLEPIASDATAVIIGGLNQMSLAFQGVGVDVELTKDEINVMFTETKETAVTSLEEIYSARMLHFEATLAMLDGEKTKSIEMWSELLDDTEAEALETSESLFKKLDAGTKKKLRAFEDAEFKKQLAAEQTAAELVSVMGNTVNRVVGSMKFLHTESTGVFKNMAADFSQYFVSSALQSLATRFIGVIGGGGILGMISKIFDTTANDRMAMMQGRDFADFFIRGTMERFRGVNLGQQIASSFAMPTLQSPYQSGYSLPKKFQEEYFSRPGYDIDEMGAELVKSSQRGFSNLSFQEDFLTENTGYG